MWRRRLVWNWRLIRFGNLFPWPLTYVLITLLLLLVVWLPFQVIIIKYFYHSSLIMKKTCEQFMWLKYAVLAGDYFAVLGRVSDRAKLVYTSM